MVLSVILFFPCLASLDNTFSLSLKNLSTSYSFTSFLYSSCVCPTCPLISLSPFPCSSTICLLAAVASVSPSVLKAGRCSICSSLWAVRFVWLALEVLRPPWRSICSSLACRSPVRLALSPISETLSDNPLFFASSLTKPPPNSSLSLISLAICA